jgi:hypothetical protein
MGRFNFSGHYFLTVQMSEAAGNPAIDVFA